MLAQGVRVDLGHDERHVLVHAPLRGVVDDDGARLGEARRPLALTPEPAEKSAMSKPWIASSESATQVSPEPPQGSVRPAERSDANGTTSSAGNERSASTSSIVEPTAPVAPTTATRIG